VYVSGRERERERERVEGGGGGEREMEGGRGGRRCQTEYFTGTECRRMAQ
jgi:hypothetical protein